MTEQKRWDMSKMNSTWPEKETNLVICSDVDGSRNGSVIQSEVSQKKKKRMSYINTYVGTSWVAQMVKHLSTMWETGVQSLGREDPRRRQWHPTPILLPGKSHGWRSLVGYSPWGCKKSDMTERLHHHHHEI